MNRGLWVTGLVLMVAPFFIFLMMVGGGDLDAFIGGWIFIFTIGPVMFIAGLILLIAGLASGGQQQQQQVVVYADGGQARHCTNCGASIESGHRFCAGCGVTSG